jgi:hypothetical protein
MRLENLSDEAELMPLSEGFSIEDIESERPSDIELPSIEGFEDLADEWAELSYEDSERETDELPSIAEETEEDIIYDKQDIKDNDEFSKNCPVEHGSWEAERGNSKWVPDPDYVPQKKNPEQEKWSDILDKFSIDGINFKDGEPDFSEVSKGDVEIESFSTNRDDNFDKADIELAKQKGCRPEDVEKWRKENNYTWHECKDMKTMQKVPSIVHNNVSHRGGISEAKGGN